MNVHDSEKVIGTLAGRGYEQSTSRKRPAWSSTTPAASATRPSKKSSAGSQHFKREPRGKGKVFGVLGCVAQQEGEKIFEQAPHVSLVCGSASYTQLPELLVRIEAGERRVTGLSLDTDETFETPFTRRDNPHRAYITIIEGCDKSLRLLRGAVHARPGAQPHQRERSARSRASWPPTGYTEIQLLGQNVNSYRDPSPARLGFRAPAGRSRARCPASGACASPPRIRAISRKDIVDAIDGEPGALRSRASARAVRFDARARADAARSTRATNTCAASSG